MLKSVTLEVVGNQKITCEGCEERVQRMLKALPGVDQVRAHSRNQRVEVLFDASVLNAGAIAKRLNEAGYETKTGS